MLMFTAGEGRLKTRCRTFPPLYVGVLLLNVRLKCAKERQDRKTGACQKGG